MFKNEEHPKKGDFVVVYVPTYPQNGKYPLRFATKGSGSHQKLKFWSTSNVEKKANEVWNKVDGENWINWKDVDEDMELNIEIEALGE
jgi:hypothetical protein